MSDRYSLVELPQVWALISAIAVGILWDTLLLNWSWCRCRSGLCLRLLLLCALGLGADLWVLDRGSGHLDNEAETV